MKISKLKDITIMYNISTKAISKRGWFTLLALIATICVSAQNVKGVVVDETDMPMIGATVMVKGSQTGTTTDFDGNFTIQAQKGSTPILTVIIQLMYRGMQS
jgi:hypothetical protein